MSAPVISIFVRHSASCKMEAGQFVGQRGLMMNSVQLWESSVGKYIRQRLMTPIANSGMYRWLGPYGPFLGHMAVLPK